MAILSFSYAIKMTRNVRDMLWDNVEVIHISFSQQMEDIVRDETERDYKVVEGGKSVQNPGATASSTAPP